MEQFEDWQGQGSRHPGGSPGSNWQNVVIHDNCQRVENMKQATSHRFNATARPRTAELEARALGRFERDGQAAAETMPRSGLELEQINVWLATDLRLYKREITRPSNGSPLLRIIFKRESAPHSPTTD